MFVTNTRTLLSLALFCASSALVLPSAAQAQDIAAETVVVTGSRVITDLVNSPTPLTVVTTEQLQATMPTGDLTDALVQLPQFLGSNNARTSSNAGTNTSADALDLRNLGPERTLVLFDGKRAVTSSQDNTVDIATLPQMLVQRVDVVTGGASAVYGSDAVAGVVNFVLDKNFTGLKVDANSGISNYEDGATYNLGIAAGTDLFSGRAHIEGDLRITHSDAIFVSARPGADNILTGVGSAANPYVYSTNVHDTNLTPGGKITCTGCAANGMQFISNGIIGPFYPGQATGSSGLDVGGDGGTSIHSTLAPMTAAEESFIRFSYNINNDTVAYFQGSVNQSYTKSEAFANYINTGATPSLYFSNNPYLPAAAQAALADPSGTFTSNAYFLDQGNWGAQQADAIVGTQSGTVGLDGELGKFNWSIFNTYGASRAKVSNPHNQNQQTMWAANDAVAGPNGTIECYASTVPSLAALYPGCVPIDPFGPTALTASQYNYLTKDTYYVETDTLDDLGGSIAGDVFDGWAGPVKGALSFETRWQSLGINSNGQIGYVNCTGLRLCNASDTIYGGTVIASMPTHSENVWEIAGEMNVPLLKDVPLVRDLSADLAGRFTDYSISGSVETWKIGLDYHVNDDVRFRATTSVDIRAPNLYELYEPISVTHSQIVDPLTGVNSTMNLQLSGNPNLTPETSRTYTAGVVVTPEFIPGLTASVDYYRINMTNVISEISGQNPSILSLCVSSGGTAAFCSLIQRPFPYSNTTAANFPTLALSEALNAAFQRTEGLDIELDDSFKLSDVWADVPGSVNLRMLANYMPVMESEPFPGSPLTFAPVQEVDNSNQTAAMSKGHVTSFLGYNVGSWSFDLSDRWIAGYPKGILYSLIYANPRVNSVNYQDITIDKKFTIDDQVVDGYLTVENVGNVLPPLALVSQTNKPGAEPYGMNGANQGEYDLIGRFFTIGIRAQF